MAAIVTAACGEEEPECAQGAEGCACYPNETCNDDLVCLSNLCVDRDGKPDDNGDDESDGGNGGGAGKDGGKDDPDVTEDPDKPNPNVDGGGGGGGGGGNPDDTNDNDPGDTNSPDDTDPDNPDDTSGGSPGTPPAGSPVAEHGALRVSGTHLVDEHGNSVQLKGVSSMWLNWEEDGYAEDKAGLHYMRDNWNLSVIRAAMGIEADDESPTYLTDPAHAKAQVEKIVQNAIDLGVYVIIDWHDHEAIAHQAQAQAFFDEMAEKYGDVPNVLYEVFNEPLDLSWAGELKPYHEALRDTIRAKDANNVIILGTPNWDQDVDVAAQSPVAGDNLMYTLHFYSCTHTAYPFLDRASNALNAGLPLFVSEWGAATADGIDTDSTCIAEATTWHDWMDENGISWAAWKFDNCDDATCFFPDGAAATAGGWQDADLNGLHAQFAVARMKTDYTPVVVDPDPDPDPDPECTASGTCADGNAMDCDAQGEPVEVDCSACAVLTCGTACCDRVGVFAAYLTAISYDYYEAPELVASYSADAEAVSLSAEFDTSIPSWFQQFAVHSFRLTSTKDATDAGGTLVCVDTNEPDMMSFTFENGGDGCAVTLYQVTEGCYAPLLVDNCWGNWLSIGAWNQLNVRTMATQYSTNFSTTLTVTSVDIP